ncbi:peptide transporter-like protein PTR2 [Boeremia exigua]|uniref:peptide transporter-like protein PTR2 n=1 Tax=Boeremia exigua TaxID=749465 RepID=UPI001E8CC2C3|nr:peptide transporter-like protein PTR2 [Boeremia exigua]KAH6644175.1 peptide transporter-like protein PTR2 [Boeremia exigua]
MASSWRTRNTSQLGTYTTLAQTEDPHGEAPPGEHSSGDPPAPLPAALYIGSTPTPEDLLFLPRVPDALPPGAFLVAVVELCERFAYYGLAGPLQNYIANGPRDASGLPGALGLGQRRATALTNAFQLWCYVTPLLGAVVADAWLGRYRTIKYFSAVYMAGIAVLVASSTPWSVQRGWALPGLVVAMGVVGLGTGGIKSNVSPLIAEQVRSTNAFVEVRRGKRVVVDPEVTVQRIYMVFYMCVNVGSVSAIATTMLELHVGFWSAFLLPFVMFCVGYAVLVAGKDRYVIKPPQGGVIGSCFRALWIAARNGFDIDKARPSALRQRVSWDDTFIDELKSALTACKIFLFFPIYWVAYSQMLNNFVSQAGQMQLHGLPNDILPNIDPITIILLVPVMDRLIYPFIRTRLHLAFTPTTRITLGFLTAALAMLYAGALQSHIYSSPPCFSSPLSCPDALTPGAPAAPNTVHVAWQTPAYVLVALSEILASITGLEVAYARAPAQMKSFIMSLFLLTSAGGSALGVLVAPLARDPWLGWVYCGLGVLAAGTGGLFWWTFRGLEEEEAKGVVEEGFELESRSSVGEEDGAVLKGV